METLDSSIIILGWIGLIAVCALAIPTLYFWALWVWSKLLEYWPFIPRGHMKATSIAISLSFTERPISWGVAHYVIKEIADAERLSPGLTKDLEDLWKKRSELE